MSGRPVVSAVVVNFSRCELLRDCLSSLVVSLTAADVAWELIVVDNGSTDDSAAMVEAEFPVARLVRLDSNTGFAGGVTTALAHCLGDWIFLVNNDAVVEPDSVSELLSVAQGDVTLGAVAATMVFADRPDVINSAGLGVDRLGVAFDRLLGCPAASAGDAPTEVFGASGGAALLRSAMVASVGGFDNSFFAFLEDADLAWRARRAGWRAVHAPRAVVRHRHSATARHRSDNKLYLVGRNRVRLLAKNATTRLLLTHGLQIAAYDLAYVAYVLVRYRSSAAARGRLAGLREWRRYRRAASRSRAPVELDPIRGFRAALQRNRAWG